MRLIDADKLKKYAIPCEIHNGVLTDMCVPLYQIDNAPTVEITEEQAIDKLHETGWLIRHDKKMTDRPQGEWIMESKLYGGFGDSVLVITCSICKESFIYRGKTHNFCPNCGAEMTKGENNGSD